jgi:hypothetical protein
MHFDYLEIHHSDEGVSGEGAAKEDHMSWIETETKDTEFVRPIKQPRKEMEMKQTGFSPAKENSFQKKGSNNSELQHHSHRRQHQRPRLVVETSWRRVGPSRH